MTPRKVLASALLALCVGVASAATTMTVTLPDGTTRTVVVTNDTELTFGDGMMTYAPGTPGGQNESFVVSNDTEITFTAGAAGVAEVLGESTTLRLRTNPVDDRLELVGDFDGTARLEIYALQGARVLSIDWQGQPVDVAALTPGIYILNINNRTIKFIKK